jgi:non-ribosomal peptide synthetase component F
MSTVSQALATAKPLCLNELIAAQTAEFPNAIAVRSKEEQLTYRELDHAAKRFAGILRAAGVKPNDHAVSLCKLSGVDLCTLCGVLFEYGPAGWAYGRDQETRP